jgi:hypothetical protein
MFTGQATVHQQGSFILDDVECPSESFCVVMNADNRYSYASTDGGATWSSGRLIPTGANPSRVLLTISA